MEEGVTNNRSNKGHSTLYQGLLDKMLNYMILRVSKVQGSIGCYSLIGIKSLRS